MLDNQTMELDFLKQLDITKDLADALAYLHAQVRALHHLCALMPDACLVSSSSILGMDGLFWDLERASFEEQEMHGDSVRSIDFLPLCHSNLCAGQATLVPSPHR